MIELKWEGAMGDTSEEPVLTEVGRKRLRNGNLSDSLEDESEENIAFINVDGERVKVPRRLLVSRDTMRICELCLTANEFPPYAHAARCSYCEVIIE